MSEQDTRKRLLNGICGSKSEKTPEIARKDGVLNISDVQEAYDRIAELTEERERYRDNMLTQTRRVAELTAERDKLQAAIDAMGNGQFYSMYKAKCEECEQLKKVVRTQADSFKKLEIELAGKL